MCVCVQEPTMGWTRGSKRDGGVGALQPNMVKVVAIVLLFEGLFLVAGLLGTREFFSSTYVQLGGGKIAVARGNPAHPSKKVGWTVAGYTATNLVGLGFSTSPSRRRCRRGRPPCAARARSRRSRWSSSGWRTCRTLGGRRTT